MSNKLPTKRQLQQWLKEAQAEAYQAQIRANAKQNEIYHLANELQNAKARLNRLMSVALEEDYRTQDICLQLRFNPRLLNRSISPHSVIMDEVDAAIHQHHQSLRR